MELPGSLFAASAECRYWNGDILFASFSEPDMSRLSALVLVGLLGSLALMTQASLAQKSESYPPFPPLPQPGMPPLPGPTVVRSVSVLECLGSWTLCPHASFNWI
jgi:hypothetical protein